MTAPSIAICISGQIRTPVSELKNIAEEAKASGADVFVSVWSEIGQKTFEGAVGPKNIRRIITLDAAQILPENWLGRMKGVFPNFRNYFPQNTRTTKAEIEAIFAGAVVEVEDDGPQFDFAQNDSNSLRMLHKIWRVNQLKRNAENARGARYDKVLRVRPDMLFSGEALQNLKLEADQVFVQGHGNKREDYLNDTIWVASSANDDKLCALYQKCKNTQELGWLGIHRELAGVVKQAGLKPELIRIIKAAKNSPESESSALAELVSKNLLQAMAKNEMDPSNAGGVKFCALVSSVVQDCLAHGNASAEPGTRLSDEVFGLLDEVEKENRNAHLQALIYLSNISILDKSLPAPDRIALLFGVLSYYAAQNAALHLEIRIAELPEIFENHAAELQQALCSQSTSFTLAEEQNSKTLLAKLDASWGARIKANQAEMCEKAKQQILSTTPFVLRLHRTLSNSELHQQAYDLSKAWAKNTPEFWRVYELMASSAEQLGQIDLAESIYIEADQKVGPHPRLQELKGNMFARTGNLEASCQAFEKALSLPGCNQKRVAGSLEKMKTRLSTA